MNDLQKELQDLKAKVAELEARVAANPVNWDPIGVKKWEPKGGDWWIKGTGKVGESYTTDGPRLFGMERETKEQAQRAAVEMRRFNRLLALRDELCGDDGVEWKLSKGKWRLYFDHNANEWSFDTNNYLEYQTPYFSTALAAQKACDMLNSGEVEL